MLFIDKPMRENEMLKITRKAKAPKTSATCTECDITGMHLMKCSKWTPTKR